MGGPMRLVAWGREWMSTEQGALVGPDWCANAPAEHSGICRVSDACVVNSSSFRGHLVLFCRPNIISLGLSHLCCRETLCGHILHLCAAVSWHISKQLVRGLELSCCQVFSDKLRYKIVRCHGEGFKHDLYDYELNSKTQAELYASWALCVTCLNVPRCAG